MSGARFFGEGSIETGSRGVPPNLRAFTYGLGIDVALAKLLARRRKDTGWLVKVLRLFQLHADPPSYYWLNSGWA